MDRWGCGAPRDVITHAVIDALCGAAGLGDIGTLFPPGREELRGISSLVLLERTAAMLTERGLSIANVDVTVVLEAPRVAPLATAMRRAMARALALPDERISVKAKTNERMGFVGRGEGIAAFAVVLLNSPDED